MIELTAMNCSGVKTVEQATRGNPDGFFLEPKLDGFRLVAHIEDGTVASYTRSLKRQDGKLPRHEAELLEMFPPDTVIDGEICRLKPGGMGNDFEAVQSVMLSKPATAAMKELRTPLQYLVFDITRYAGQDVRGLPLSERRRILEQLVTPGSSRIALIPQFPAKQEVHEALVAADWEGSVLKAKDSTYLSGGRGSGWFKLKAQPDVDVIIIGYQAGRGKFEGQVGAVEFAQPDENGVLVKRGQCSGMDDAQRRYMTDNMDALIGTVITIKPFGTLGKGLKFRMPQFDRFRPDKPASEVCWHDR